MLMHRPAKPAAIRQCMHTVCVYGWRFLFVRFCNTADVVSLSHSHCLGYKQRILERDLDSIRMVFQAQLITTSIALGCKQLLIVHSSGMSLKLYLPMFRGQHSNCFQQKTLLSVYTQEHALYTLRLWSLVFNAGHSTGEAAQVTSSTCTESLC